MTAGFHLLDGRGTKTRASVDDLGALLVNTAARPPLSAEALAQPMRVFRQHLTDDGLATDGTNQDMRVNGSSTSVDFYIASSQTKDRYISRVSFLLADASATLNKFGNLTALTTGCRLFYTDEEGEVDIHNAIKSNFQLVRLCSGLPAFAGAGAAPAFRATNVSGTSEGYLPVLDMRDTFGFQWGLRLKKGSSQRLTMRIRDDLSTGIDQMDAIAYGFEIE